MTTAIIGTGGLGSVIARQLASGGETTPPRPSTRASDAAQNRRARSFSSGASARNRSPINRSSITPPEFYATGPRSFTLFNYPSLAEIPPACRESGPPRPLPCRPCARQLAGALGAKALVPDARPSRRGSIARSSPTQSPGPVRRECECDRARFRGRSATAALLHGNR